MASNLTKSRAAHDPTLLGRNFKSRLRRGEVLIGGMLSEYARPSLIKLYCQAGFDFLFIECEHALFNPVELVDTLICAQDNGLPVIAKTAQLERPETARLLDNGAVGVQLPRTESRIHLETLIGYMKFPPHGSRAGAPCFANVDYVWPSDHQSWLKNADEAATVVAHIETAAGYNRAEEIISTPHLDMLYVGPYDFSIAMGHPGDYDHPDVVKPMRRMLDICKEYGVPFGTTASSVESASDWVKRGAQFFETIDEMSLIAAGARELVAQYQKICPGRRKRTRKS